MEARLSGDFHPAPQSDGTQQHRLDPREPSRQILRPAQVPAPFHHRVAVDRSP